jgi:methyl-accepting chemotaxis protein
MVMHPIKTEMDGKNLSDEKDPNGKRFFVAMVETCKNNGAGFVDYLWPKPGFAKPVPKISYVKSFPDWGWIIGSGIYLDDVEKEISQILYVMFGVAGVIVVGGLLLSYFMARSISRPINHVIEGLTDGADQVASGSTQVASASQSLAEGASEQAAGIEETSSSIEEMSSMTKQNAGNAQQANTLMTDTSRVVEEANSSMKALTQSMSEISAASEETGKIIKTIDEIAFQTNLLALNAAVEAARAGEAGAGFAVVADEVRNLAMRAADAAKNTANLIEGTVKKIKNGSEIVAKTNEAFVKVAGGAKKVGELVSEIAAASQEQAQGIDQINKAVAEMDKVVQKNAASAEESASASEEMNAQAEQMKTYVRELVVLVGGKKNANGVATFKDSHHAGISTGQMATLNHKEKTGVEKGLTALTKREKDKGTEVAVHKTKEIKPDQIIPMEGGDFKQF